MSGIRKAPCYNCKERSEGCHGTCERYKAYDAECQIKRANRLGDNLQYNGYTAEKAIKQDRARKRKER